MPLLPPHLQAFFTDRLIRQKQASPHTIAAYRDTWRLLLAYAGQQAGKTPSRPDIGALGAGTVTGPSTTSNTPGDAPRAPATPGSRRSGPCSATWRPAVPSTPAKAPAPCPSPPSHSI